MIRLSLCDYNDAYILVSGTITTTGEGAYNAEKRLDKRNKRVIFNNIRIYIYIYIIEMG